MEQVFGPGAEISYGDSQINFGSCLQIVDPVYEWNASHTAVLSDSQFSGTYSYGGNSKEIVAHYTVNDTVSFPSNQNAPLLANINVAVSNFSAQGQVSPHCSGLTAVTMYDLSILGLGPVDTIGREGPYFRRNLLDQERIKAPVVSMWMDAQGEEVNSTLYGTVLLGAIAEEKYTGELVFVESSFASNGYYVGAPAISVSSINNPLEFITLTSTNVTTAAAAGGDCLLDSGSIADSLLVDGSAFANATGFEVDESTGYAPAINGSCDQIPKTAAIKYAFSAAKGGQPLEIKVPLRLYARDTFRYNDHQCFLSINFDTVGGECVFSSAFLSGAYVAIDDAHSAIAMAEGSVSQGAREGVQGLGPVKYIQEGQQIPAR